eukprot:5978570-Prymnesium_polylepis.1
MLHYLSSLSSVVGLSGCISLQMLEFKEFGSHRKMDKIHSMPDLSALPNLEVKGLPEQLQAWEANGRKRFIAEQASAN